METLPFLLLLTLSLFDLCTSKDNVLRMEKERLDALLASSVYDRAVRPSGINGTGPVKVTINMYIRSIEAIDDEKMDFTTQITFRESWNDHRLAYNNIEGSKYLTLLDQDRLWKPDIFFSNEKEGHFHNMVLPNVLTRIYPNGDVLYSIRLTLQLGCPMDLKNFPMDIQHCQIIFASYGSTTDDLIFDWKSDNPIQPSKQLGLPLFAINNFETGYCTSKTITGEYGCLKAVFRVERHFHYYFIHMYMPTISLVLLSWMIFWLDYRNTSIRVGIWAALFLSNAIYVVFINSNLPVVSYNRAIDVWTGTCVTFLIAVIIEMSIVMRFVSDDKREKLESKSPHENNMDNKEGLNNFIEQEGEKKESKSANRFIHRLLNRYQSTGQKIDVACRALFPLAFLFFNIIYWSVYVRSSITDLAFPSIVKP